MDNIVNIENAFVRRDDKYILDGVSLKIKKGEHTAIIGPNGAGKSTLIDVIARKTYPLALDEYKNEIFGESRWIIQELRPLLGIVSPAEDEFFTTRYTVREIVTSGLYSSLGFDFHHVVNDSDWEKAERQIEDFGLTKVRDHMLCTLSTGEKRRTILARATITDPSLILLDEASNGLDFPMRADLRNIVSDLAKKDKTIISVTHELSEIIPEVERIILMKGGRIVMDGKKDEVLNSHNLSELYDRKVTVVRSGDIYNAFA